MEKLKLKTIFSYAFSPPADYSRFRGQLLRAIGLINDPALPLLTHIMASHDRVETGSVNIAVATFPVCDDVSVSQSEALTIAQEWLAKFSTSLHARDYSTLLKDLFVDDEPYWRDHLALDWDFRTLHGAKKIEAYLKEGNLSLIHISEPTRPY